MPANERKVAELIIEEVRSLDERCEGYRAVLTDTISDILSFEKGAQSETYEYPATSRGEM